MSEERSTSNKVPLDQEEEESEKEKEEKKEEEIKEIKRETKPQQSPIQTQQKPSLYVPNKSLQSTPNLNRKPATLNPEIPKVSTEEAKLIIPKIELQKLPSLKRMQIQLNVTIPELSKENVELTVPEIELSKPSLTRSSRRLVLDIPDIKPQPVELVVPFIDLEPPKLIRKNIKLEDKISFLPVVEKNEEREIISPLIRNQSQQPLNVQPSDKPPSLLAESEKLNRKSMNLENARSSREVEQEEQSITTYAAGSGGEGKKEFLEEIFEFDISDEEKGVKDLKSTIGVKVIVFNDINLEEEEKKQTRTSNSKETEHQYPYLDLLQEICLRLYQVAVGELPKAEEYSTINLSLDDNTKYKLTELLSGNKRIVTIKIEKEEVINDDTIRNKLIERLREVYAQSVGFIIFATSNPNIYKNLISVSFGSDFRPKFIKIRAKELPKELASILNGMVNIDKYSKLIFKKVFNIAKDKYYQELEKIFSEDKGLIGALIEPNEGEESFIHQSLKGLVIKYLINRLRKEGKITSEEPSEILREIRKHEYIKVEKPLEGTQIKPDIILSLDNKIEVYEIETLFKQGEDKIPINKLHRTIKKYLELEKENEQNMISSLNIVMDNLTLLLYHKEIKYAINDLWRNNAPFEITVYGVDVENKTLVPLEELLKKYKEILGKFNEMSKKLNG